MAAKPLRARGFPVSVERFDERTTLLIQGKHSYRANVSESPVGTIASLEHALDSFEDRLREREADLAQSCRQRTDLTKQLNQPFEHEKKLVDTTERQQEIITALDITKNQGAPILDGEVEVARQRSVQESEARNVVAVGISA